MSHTRAGRGSGLTSKGAVLRYMSKNIRAGRDEDLDQQGMWQAGSKGETPGHDKAIVDVAESQTPLLLRLDLSPGSQSPRRWRICSGP